jgi:two-component system chemotaxis response regulator CheB
MISKNVNNIVVVGASAGGFSAISNLMSSLHSEMNAAMFIVIHVGRSSMTSVVLKHIQKNTSIPCKIAEDGDSIANNTIYLAQADHHLMIEKDKILVQRGAYENHWRPAIDVLFRSAAAAYNSCVTGIILTGLLDDGTSGMSAIKRSGGICIIQDLSDAEFPDMPNNVFQNVSVDYQLPVSAMGDVLNEILSDKQCVPVEVPKDVKLEVEITMRMSSDPSMLEDLGTPTMLTCPDCGGTLRKVTDDVVGRYRCYTGHTFTEKSLDEQQIKALENSLWVAIRMMEERKNLLENLSSPNYTEQNSTSSQISRVTDIKSHIDRLKTMLLEMH